MNAIERRIEDLRAYRVQPNPPEDLRDYWDRALDQARKKPLYETITETETPLAYAKVYKVTFQGYDETPIQAWYIVPTFALGQPEGKGMADNGQGEPGGDVTGKLPCIVHFHGYTGDKGYPESYAQWLLTGAAVLAVDVRGQAGETGNLLDQSYGMIKGWVTQGILVKERSYYQAIAIDAFKACELAGKLPYADPSNIVVMGGSQGGGLALVAAALSDIPSICVAMIPNMCQMDFGILNSTSSLAEIASFLHQFPHHTGTVMNTIRYFDMMNLADRINIPTMVTAGGKDTVCMPETIFAVYNQLTSEKEIHVYPFMGHEVNGDQIRKAMHFIRKHLKE